MKGSLLWKLMYLFCGLAGVLAGYGIHTLMSAGEIKQNTITKDNTLVREAENSVFFDGEKEEPEVPVLTQSPIAVPTPAVTPIPAPELPVAEQVELPEVLEDKPELPEITSLSTEDLSAEQPPILPEADIMPSLASQWVLHAPPELPDATTPSVVLSSEQEEMELPENPATETITYPAEIFGQVPVINRSDTYISYFEFAYDLIEMLEPEVKQRGLNMNALLAKFVIKALFCGVDIEQLDINAPIPRKQAALCLWLAAQLLNESGTETSAKSAQKYVTDIGGCSSAEKKAVAYLYEQGILKEYQTSGQKFYPEAGLTTKAGNAWLSGVKQHWK